MSLTIPTPEVPEIASGTYEFVWACGLFEGEGTWNPASRQMAVRITDLDVLERFQAAVGGLGSITTETIPRSALSKKQSYSWVLGKWKRVEALTRAMLPWLGVRRRSQADAFLANPAKFSRDTHRYGRCRKGHNLSEVGVYANGRDGGKKCAECCRQAQKRRREKVANG